MKLYVPGLRPVTVAVGPDPAVSMLPGYLVRVHEPVAGRLPKMMLPVGTVHPGCVILPVTGGSGVTGCSCITTWADSEETHPSSFVTVKV